MNHQTFYRRKLPHLQPQEGTFFITYRLYGSVPIPVIKNLRVLFDIKIQALNKNIFHKKNEANEKLTPPIEEQLQRIFKKKKYSLEKIYFKEFDNYLDFNLNKPYWLRNPEIAQLNMNSLQFFNQKYYTLWAATIMPNHVHILITLNQESPPLWNVLKRIKSFTGKKGNILLNRTGEGKFWEEESYDHLVRKGEFSRILDYILNNPVKAKLVSNWKDWKWTYCHPTYLE